jgi:hypothetical protein
VLPSRSRIRAAEFQRSLAARICLIDMHLYSGSLTPTEEQFLRDTLEQFSKKPYSQLQILPDYMELEVPTYLHPLTAGLYRDILKNGQVQIVIQGCRHENKVGFVSFDAVKAYGFKKDSFEQIREVPEKELFEFM